MLSMIHQSRLTETMPNAYGWLHAARPRFRSDTVVLDVPK
jgi:hypothetical protein